MNLIIFYSFAILGPLLVSLGADVFYSARAFMLALGCIQALRCHSNKCPTGVATQNPHLVTGLDVTDNTFRVATFHKEILKSVAELLGAMGLQHTQELRPWHVMRRAGHAQIKHYGELFNYRERCFKK